MACPLVLLIALFNACKPEPGPVIAQRDLDEVAVELEARTMLAAYGQAQREQGLLGEVPFLDTSDHFFWVPPGFAGRIDRDSVITLLTANAAYIERVDPQWAELEVNPLSSTVAAYSGRLRVMVVKTSGDSTMTELLETGVLIERRDGWKLLCGQTSLAPTVTSEDQ